jgi:putative ABC transport system permease protein
MLQDYKLGLRMLLKYPGLTLAGGLALAIAIGVGAGWYDLSGKLFAPTIPLPEGDRLVVVETLNTLTGEPEPRVAHDFLEWRRSLRTIETLGAYRTGVRSLVVGGAPAGPISSAEITAAGFGAARVPPLIGRALLESDEMPGAPGVVVLGYEVWQRVFAGRQNAVGSVVTLGNETVTVIGIMPDGFGYPLNQQVWTPLSLRSSYEALEGGALNVIGRLAPGVSRQQANAELHVAGERAAAARPATHQHLRPRAYRLGDVAEFLDAAQFAARNLPVLLVLALACMSVGTLIYARTATREGEIAVRSALGASRARVMGQLFTEALVLALVAAAAGLIAADRVLTWGIESIDSTSGGPPFWMTPGLKLSTVLYAVGLAIVSAALLSLLPALRATRARVQPHLANLGSGSATLRFGGVWTGAMIVQVALTAIAIPGALESINQTMRKLEARARFPSREYLAARVDVDRPFQQESAGMQERRTRTFDALARRIAQEPAVLSVTFTDYPPGLLPAQRFAEVEASARTRVFQGDLRVATVGPGFFATFARPILAGRAFHGGDFDSGARTVVVNQAFARAFSREAGSDSPIGARLRYPRTDPIDRVFDIVGVVRDLGLDPDDDGHEVPYVFHAAEPGAMSSVVVNVRVRGNPAPLAARLPGLATAVDASLHVQDARPLEAWVRGRDKSLVMELGALVGVTSLVLFLSAMGIFSLVSVGVSRRTREIGLRAALGANPRHVVAGTVSRAVMLTGSGALAGGAFLMWTLVLGLGPSGRPADDVPLFAGYLGITSAVLLVACLLACLGPARRALRINPIEALRVN